MKKIQLFLMMVLCVGFMFVPNNIYAEENTGETQTEQFTITFDSNGGSSVATQQVDKDKTVARPSNPTRDGYTFREWQLNNSTYNFNEKVTADITLVAVWDQVQASPTPAPSSSGLSGLKVDNLDFDQEFDTNLTRYTITVPANTTTVNISATPDANSDILTGTGRVTLKDGETTVQVITKLKTTNDKEKTYTIVITRESPDITLESLKITGFALKEAFVPTLYNYTVEVPYETEAVNVIAKAADSNSSVAVSGAENLVVGDNTVTVTVTYVTGTKQEYKIIVTRLKEEEEPSTPIQSEATTSSITGSTTSTGSSSGNDILKYVLIVVGCLLILLLAGLGIFFYFKSETPEKKMARLEKKKAKAIAKAAKTNKEIKEVAEEVDEEIKEVEEVQEELEQTKEAPAVDHSDILDGIDELFDDEEK